MSCSMNIQEQFNSYSLFCDYNHKMSHLEEKASCIWATLRHFDGVRVNFSLILELDRMPRRKAQKERQIESDDELSASGPEMSSDDAMSEDELNEHEVMRVQGQG